MAQKTDGQLTTEANIIRDETAVGANTALRIGTMLDNLIDSKVNVDKVSDDTALGNSTTLVPSQNAVKTYVDTLATGLLTDNGNYDPTITSEYPTSGNTLSGGAVQKGDIWYISADGTINGNSVLTGYSVRALVDNAGATTDGDWSISNVGLGYVPENVANKSTDVSLGTSDIYYPSQNAVKTYVDNQVASTLPYTPENIANKNQDISAAPTSTVLYPSNKAVADFVAANISTPSLQDVVAVNPTATTSFGCAAPTGAAITANSSSDPSAASIEAYTGAGGYVIITNENGNASSIRATNLTNFRTHQLPDASGILALTSDIIASYKSYVVNLDWDGATWSTTAIYQNTLGGAVTLSNLGGSRMKLITSGLFTSGKTVVIPSIIAQGQATLIGVLDPSFSSLPNDLVIRWNNASGVNAVPASFASNAVYILEVRVYP